MLALQAKRMPLRQRGIGDPVALYARHTIGIPVVRGNRGDVQALHDGDVESVSRQQSVSGGVVQETICLLRFHTDQMHVRQTK
jgi:hypothetical protein